MSQKQKKIAGIIKLFGLMLKILKLFCFLLIETFRLSHCRSYKGLRRNLTDDMTYFWQEATHQTEQGLTKKV